MRLKWVAFTATLIFTFDFYHFASDDFRAVIRDNQPPPPPTLIAFFHLFTSGWKIRFFRSFGHIYDLFINLFVYLFQSKKCNAFPAQLFFRGKIPQLSLIFALVVVIHSYNWTYFRQRKYARKKESLMLISLKLLQWIFFRVHFMRRWRVFISWYFFHSAFKIWPEITQKYHCKTLVDERLTGDFNARIINSQRQIFRSSAYQISRIGRTERRNVIDDDIATEFATMVGFLNVSKIWGRTKTRWWKMAKNLSVTIDNYGEKIRVKVKLRFRSESFVFIINIMIMCAYAEFKDDNRRSSLSWADLECFNSYYSKVSI